MIQILGIETKKEKDNELIEEEEENPILLVRIDQFTFMHISYLFNKDNRERSDKAREEEN